MTKKYNYLHGRLRQMGLTQEDVGRKLGIKQQAVSARFNGRQPWSVDEMYLILELCKAPAEDLHLYFPPNGISAGEQRLEKRDPAGDAAEYLSGFIRCILKEAMA